MPTRKIKTKYFMFRQNNSGGSFDINDAKGIGRALLARHRGAPGS